MEPSNARATEGDIHPVASLGTDYHETNHTANNHLDRGMPRRRTVTAIIFGSIGAIMCMIGHHLFLSWLEGRHALLQFWMKNASNAFSQLGVVFIGLVAGSILSQWVWRTLSQRYTIISTIDDLFSLPSPLSILSLTGLASKDRAGWLLLPLLMALFIQALVVVSILAPNSLGIQPGVWTVINTTVPKLDFGSISLGISSLDFMIAASSNTWDIWDVPPDCQSECSIAVEYYAPAVQCRELRREEITLAPYNGSKATWLFYDSDFGPSIEIWGQPYPGFWMEYLPSVSKILDATHLQVNQTGEAAGMHCDFLDGKFQGTFSITNGVKHVEVTPLSYNNGSTDGCTWDPYWNITSSTRCIDYGNVAQYLVFDFTGALVGEVGWLRMVNDSFNDASYDPHSVMYYAPSSTSLKQFLNLTLVDDPNNPTTDNENPHFIATIEAESANLSKKFEDLFSKTMLAVMISDNRTEFGLARTTDGANVWTYSRVTLWVTYGPTTAVLLALTIYGLWHAKANQRSLSTEFSTLFVTSRNRALNTLFSPSQARLKEGYMKLDGTQRLFVVQRTLDGSEEDIVSKGSISSDDHGPQSPLSLPTSSAAPKVMAGLFMVAVILAALHHVFLTMLREKPVTLQFWMRNISNGLSQGVALCLGAVLAHALTQAVWRAIRLESMPIAGIDYLFSLPSPSTILTRFFGRSSLAFLLVILITWTTYGLFLISVLAPNVLTIDQSTKKSAQIDLPYFNYSLYFYGDLSEVEELASHTPPEQIWTTPDICTSSCAFEFYYEAPALFCSDVYPDESFFNASFRTYEGSGSSISEGPVYSGQSILAATAYIHELDTILWHSPQLEVAYIPVEASISGNSQPVIQRHGNPVVTVCNYTNGTYNAMFQLEDGVKRVTTILVHYNNSYTERCFGRYGTDTSCYNYATASGQLTDTFSAALEGLVGFWRNGTNGTDETSGVNETQWIFQEIPGNATRYLYPTTLVSPGPLRLFDYHSTVTTNGAEVSLSLKVPSLSQGLIDLFSNYTLSLMREGENILSVTGTVWGETVWKVDLFTLWCIYGIALGWTFILSLYGAWAMYDNGVPLDNSVSTIILATRTEELDAAYESVPNHEALLKIRLRHEKKSYFVVDGVQPKVEEKGEESSVLLTGA